MSSIAARSKRCPKVFFCWRPLASGPCCKPRCFRGAASCAWPAELLLPRGKPEGDESLGAFVRRRFGREALERVAQPLVGGIYASDPDRLSLGRDHAPVQRNGTPTPKRHLGDVVRAAPPARKPAAARVGACSSLWPEECRNSSTPSPSACPKAACASTRRSLRLERSEAKRQWQIILGERTALGADAVILATPAFQTATILNAIARDAAADLEQISYASTATVSLAYRREDFPRSRTALVSSCRQSRNAKSWRARSAASNIPVARRKIIFCSALSSAARCSRNCSLPTMRRWRKMSAPNSPACSASRREPLFSRIWRHPNSMPQYHVGHQARIERIESCLSKFPTLALAGSAYHGVGIADCVRTGEAAAEKVFGNLSNS